MLLGFATKIINGVRTDKNLEDVMEKLIKPNLFNNGTNSLEDSGFFDKFLKFAKHKVFSTNDDRVMVRHNSNNTGDNHKDLLGQYKDKEKEWFSLKLNAYGERIWKHYAFVIGYDRGTEVIRIYKFGKKH